MHSKDLLNDDGYRAQMVELEQMLSQLVFLSPEAQARHQDLGRDFRIIHQEDGQPMEFTSTEIDALLAIQRMLLLDGGDPNNGGQMAMHYALALLALDEDL